MKLQHLREQESRYAKETGLFRQKPLPGSRILATGFLFLYSFLGLCRATSQESSRKVVRGTGGALHAGSRPGNHGETRPTAAAPSATAVPAEKPATVLLNGAQLTIRAENSNLTQILQDVSRASGMVVEGDVHEARVYGVYGPAEPAAVLSELLDGMGYNVMILGGSGDNRLKRLILSARAGVPTPPSAVISAPANNASPAAAAPPAESNEPVLGPGAIAHPVPPPQQTDQQRIQQNLQNLMKRHGQQQQPDTQP